MRKIISVIVGQFSFKQVPFWTFSMINDRVHNREMTVWEFPWVQNVLAAFYTNKQISNILQYFNC